MKMINAGAAAITEAGNYQYNCILNKCQRQYYVPVPTLAEVQLYVNFGPNKPNTLTWTLLEACAYNSTAETTVGCFKIAYNGTNWYGIFTNFSSAANFTLFSFAMEVVYVNTTTATFFSEQYQIPTAGCAAFTKLAVCYPTNYNADDINGIYVGQHNNAEPFSGREDLFYQHKYWVRDAEVLEVQNQITFKANPTRNFATTLNKIFEFRPEPVPGWYKDYLLAVYFRGNFTINGTETKATELAFEVMLEEADIWKAYVKLDKELKGAFGCATIACEDYCACYPPTMPVMDYADAVEGVPYIKTVAIGGSTVFVLSAVTKPDWMTITVVGSNLVFSGTPGVIEADQIVSFTITNDCGTISKNGKINVVADTCENVVILSDIELPAATQDVPYNYTIYLSGTAPFTLSGIIKPAWMFIGISGSEIYISGTPSDIGTFEVYFKVNNCSAGEAIFDTDIEVSATSENNFEVQNTAASGSITGVSPEFYLINVGGFPVGPTASLQGYQGGYSSVINVTLSGVVEGEQLQLLKNGVVEESKPLTLPGTYTLNATGSITFLSTDSMIIKLAN